MSRSLVFAFLSLIAFQGCSIATHQADITTFTVTPERLMVGEEATLRISCSEAGDIHTMLPQAMRLYNVKDGIRVYRRSTLGTHLSIPGPGVWEVVMVPQAEGMQSLSFMMQTTRGTVERDVQISVVAKPQGALPGAAPVWSATGWKVRFDTGTTAWLELDHGSTGTTLTLTAVNGQTVTRTIQSEH